MMRRTVSLVLCAALLSLTACAGPKYLKKRNLSSVVQGAPIGKTKALKKPSLVSRITKGKHNGAQLYVYEWDKPKDPIINQMFTYVVVRDGKVEAIYEDPADKYDRDPQAYRAAWAQSEALREQYRAINAQTARQIAIGVAAGLAGAGAAMAAAGNSYNAPYYQPAPVYNPGFGGARSFIQPNALIPPTLPSYAVSSPMVTSASATSRNAYATMRGSSLRDYGRINPIGIVDGQKVYASMPGSSIRDYGKINPIGIVDDGKVYATRPGSSLRDYGRINPIGVLD